MIEDYRGFLIKTATEDCGTFTKYIANGDDGTRNATAISVDSEEGAIKGLKKLIDSIWTD